MSPQRAKRSIAVEWGEDLAIPLAPIQGMWGASPGISAPANGSPDMLNCSVRGMVLTKRPGYSPIPSDMTSLGGPIMGLYSSIDDDNLSYLYAATPTELYYLDPVTDAWVQVTGAALTGGVDRLFQFETSENKVLFSQGADPIQVTDFGGATYAGLDADAPAAHAITTFAERVFIANTLESAIPKPKRVRRSVNGDHTDWTGIGSGFTDLAETPYHVKNIKKIGTALAVYKEKSIHLGTRTETPDAPVRFDLEVTDIGLYAAQSLQGRNEFHYFLGGDDFYMFNGQAVESFGWQVRDHVYNTLNINKLYRVFSAMTFDSQEYLCFIPTGAANTPNRVWVYHWAERIWVPWSVSGPTVATIHRIETTTTIDDVTTPIDENTWEIDAQSAQAGYPALITGGEDGRVYRWSKGNLSDAGVSIPCYWSSRDFTPRDIGAPQNTELTLLSIYVRYKGVGNECTLTWSASINGGASWISVGDMMLEAQAGADLMSHIEKQVTGPEIRIRFENDTTDEDFQIMEIIPVFQKPETTTRP